MTIHIKKYEKKNNKTLYFLFCGISKRVFFKLKMRYIRFYDDIFKKILEMQQLNNSNFPQIKQLYKIYMSYILTHIKYNKNKDNKLAKKVEVECMERTSNLEQEKEKMQQEMIELNQQLQEKTKLFSELQELSTAARDKLITLTTENIDLRKR